MKRKALKLITLCLCLIIVGTMAAGCQGSGKGKDDAAYSNGTKSTSEETDKTSDAGSSKKLSDELVVLKALRDDPASQPIRQDSPTYKYIEENLNVRLEIEAVPAASYEDKKKILITTNNLPDLMLVKQQDIKDFAKSGVFLNISENMDKMPNFKRLYEMYPDMRKLQVDGSLYGCPITCRWQERGGQTCVVRIDLLEKNNLDIPKSFDEFYEVLKVFKEKYPDKIPFTNRKGGSTSGTQKVLDTMAYPLGSGSGIYFDHDVEGGKYLYGPATPQFKEVLKYLNKLYAEKLLDQDYATNTAEQWKEKMSSGKALSYFDNAGFAEDFNLALSEIDPDAAVVPIPTMSNSLGQTRNWFYQKHWFSSSYIISSSSKNKDVAIALYDWFYSEEGCDLMGFGIEGEHFEYVDGKPKMLDSVLKQYADANAPAYELSSALGIGYFAFNPYVDQGGGFQMKIYGMDPENPTIFRKWFSKIETDPGMREPILDPPFTFEEAQRYKELKSAVDNILVPEYDKYIMGLEPIENYDKVIERARAAGAKEIEDIYNAAARRLAN